MTPVEVMEDAQEGRRKTNRPRQLDIPILSFFTGAGFLDLGFRQAGFSSIWHNEYSKEFVGGFEHGMQAVGLNGPAAKIQSTQSILDIGPSGILKEAFGSAGRPSCFGMIGGPPCPDFSVGGKNRGSQGENGRLTEVYANRIYEIEPSFFLLENVPGLLRTGKHREFFTKVLERLDQKYLLDLNILNALEFGVPQDRERIFLVGLNKKWLTKNSSVNYTPTDVRLLVARAVSNRDMANAQPPAQRWFPWYSSRIYEDPKGTYGWPSTNLFGSNSDRPVGLPSDLMVGPLICDPEELRLLPNGTEGFIPYSEKFQTIPEGDVSRKSFKRLHRWRYSPAAAYGNNEVHLHPTEARRISVREALRIQTVPDQYALPKGMPLSAKFKTIGNGVPVKLARAVAQAFALVLKDSEHGSV